MRNKSNEQDSEVLDITNDFGMLYHPKCALVFYESDERVSETYVEYFDMDENGNPLNAHPLTVNEAKNLTKKLNVQNRKEKEFLKPKGVLSSNILSIDNSENGKVIWFTESMERELYFVKDLNIPNGMAKVPALLWYADKQHLKIYALNDDLRPNENTELFHAPFFNVNSSGSVCMGTVNARIKKSSSLEEFVETWKYNFFNSYFSHLMFNHNPIKGNCVNLWKELIKNQKPFPVDVLIKSNLKLKNLL